MVSWVVLANSYTELTIESLRQKLDEIYPGEFCRRVGRVTPS